MLIAMQKSMCIISTAIEHVGISRQCHYDWVRTDPAYAKAIASLEEGVIDFAESKLHQLINGVELPDTKFFFDGKTSSVIREETIRILPPDTAATIFYMKTKGKDRGYIERSEITGKDGEKLYNIAKEDIPKVLDDLRKGITEDDDDNDIIG